jgi:hypothetical protein
MQDKAIEITSEKMKVLTRLSRIVFTISDFKFFPNFRILDGYWIDVVKNIYL